MRPRTRRKKPHRPGQARAASTIQDHDAGLPSGSTARILDRDGRRRILILDDDRRVAAALALELTAHDVVIADSGWAALEILRCDRDFDVILCDVMMPELSGMDVYESLRLLDPALLDRVVLMTGGAFTTQASQFVSRVDTPMIEKPFHPGQLDAIVHAREPARRVAGSPDSLPKEVA
jgi:two-component system NtrC family sensor kinase